MSEMTMGRVAFDAYTAKKGGVTYDKKPIPPWSDVGDEVRAAWEVAAKAAVESISTDGAIRAALRALETEGGPSREAALVRTKLQEAEMWFSRIPWVAP
jgi:hypothetical protein